MLEVRELPLYMNTLSIEAALIWFEHVYAADYRGGLSVSSPAFGRLRTHLVYVDMTIEYW